MEETGEIRKDSDASLFRRFAGRLGFGREPSLEQKIQTQASEKNRAASRVIEEINRSGLFLGDLDLGRYHELRRKMGVSPKDRKLTEDEYRIYGGLGVKLVEIFGDKSEDVYQTWVKAEPKRQNNRAKEAISFLKKEGAAGFEKRDLFDFYGHTFEELREGKNVSQGKEETFNQVVNELQQTFGVQGFQDILKVWREVQKKEKLKPVVTPTIVSEKKKSPDLGSRARLSTLEGVEIEELAGKVIQEIRQKGESKEYGVFFKYLDEVWQYRFQRAVLSRREDRLTRLFSGKQPPEYFERLNASILSEEEEKWMTEVKLPEAMAAKSANILEILGRTFGKRLPEVYQTWRQEQKRRQEPTSSN